jgi:carboxyl-terminal processing protease
MEHTIHSKKYFSWHNIILALVFFALGYFSFAQIQSIRYQSVDEKDLGLFWTVWGTIDEKYPFSEPSDQDKIYGAIAGLVEAYNDDYSAFLPPVSSEFFNQTISGEFGGIGAEIGVDNGLLTVISPLKDSPSEKGGLQPGDIITHVNSIDIAGDTLDESISRIRGEIGTEVVLTIVRPENLETLDITIIRDIVHIPVLDTEIIDEVFVIHLYNFNESSEDAFKEALVSFKEGGYSKLLIDVRNNPGGYLTSAVDIASYFLPQGNIVLREQTGVEEEDEIIYRSSGYDLLEGKDITIKVLTNKGSASASEILAGALHDQGYAQIVGERSYGKGSVQELIDLPQNTSVKITVAKWLTPNKAQISGVGIEPDVIIEKDENESATEDSQLQKAINLFAN